MSLEYRPGLRDVAVARSELSRIDGDAGRLVYRGYDIDDLATAASFEETLHLLWEGDLPTPDDRDVSAERLVIEQTVDDEPEHIVYGIVLTDPVEDAVVSEPDIREVTPVATASEVTGTGSLDGDRAMGDGGSDTEPETASLSLNDPAEDTDEGSDVADSEDDPALDGTTADREPAPEADDTGSESEEVPSGPSLDGLNDESADPVDETADTDGSSSVEDTSTTDEGQSTQPHQYQTCRFRYGTGELEDAVFAACPDEKPVLGHIDIGGVVVTETEISTAADQSLHRHRLGIDAPDLRQNPVKVATGVRDQKPLGLGIPLDRRRVFNGAARDIGNLRRLVLVINANEPIHAAVAFIRDENIVRRNRHIVRVDQRVLILCHVV